MPYVPAQVLHQRLDLETDRVYHQRKQGLKCRFHMADAH